MISTATTSAAVLAEALATALHREVGERVDEPEGTVTVVVSATLMRDIVRALRGVE